MESSLFIPLLLALFAVPLFLQVRRQKKAMQEQQKLQNSLVTGDRVMTTSGLFGTIVDTTEDSVDLEIADGITTTWVRAAIREKVDTETTEEQAEQDSTATEDASDAKSTVSDESNAAVAEPIEQQKTSS